MSRARHASLPARLESLVSQLYHDLRSVAMGGVSDIFRPEEEVVGNFPGVVHFQICPWYKHPPRPKCCLPLDGRKPPPFPAPPRPSPPRWGASSPGFSPASHSSSSSSSFLSLCSPLRLLSVTLSPSRTSRRPGETTPRRRRTASRISSIEP